MHGFLLDWKSVKKTRRRNYISPLKNKLIHIVGITRPNWETKIPFGFRNNLFMHGFVISSESRFIITGIILLDKPMSLITQSLNFNILTHIINILLLFLFAMNVK